MNCRSEDLSGTEEPVVLAPRLAGGRMVHVRGANEQA
jgi:hypothetical protein